MKSCLFLVPAVSDDWTGRDYARRLTSRFFAAERECEGEKRQSSCAASASPSFWKQVRRECLSPERSATNMLQ